MFLFGQVHKDLWKTEQGTVIGLLNANPMKPKEGSEEVRLSALTVWFIHLVFYQKHLCESTSELY